MTCPPRCRRQRRAEQPEILSGRSCDDLPPVSIAKLPRRVYSAFTGPGGGLASVNCTTHAVDICHKDVDFIDCDDGLPDDQPNAYVTCQKPPPRKSPFSDMAEFFRRPSHSPKPEIISIHENNLNNNNIVIDSDPDDGDSKNRNISGRSEYVNSYASRDSLECVVPAWRGEAPSPLSPHPARAPPNAFLQFGDGPLNYELTVPSISSAVEDNLDYGATRSCENICCASSNEKAVSLGGGSLGSLEGIAGGQEEPVILVSCQDSKTGTVNSLIISEASPVTSPVDQNYNPVVIAPNILHQNNRVSPAVTRSTPITPQMNPSLVDQSPHSAPSTPRNYLQGDSGAKHLEPNADSRVPQVSLQQRLLQQSVSQKSQNNRSAGGNLNSANVDTKIDKNSNSNYPSGDLTNEGGLIDHRAKFLTLELVEGCTLSGQLARHTL